MKFVFALFLILAMFAVSSEASIGRVVSYPARHPKVSGQHLKHGAQKFGHVAKKILY